MKKLLLTALIFTAPVLADIECKTRKEMAKDIMLERQVTPNIATMMQEYKKKGATKTTEFMIIAAYNYPYINAKGQLQKAGRMNDSPEKERTLKKYERMITSRITLANRFADRAFKSCMRSKGK